MSGSAPAVFNYSTWSLRFPELARSVAEDLADQYWTEAGLYLDPSGSSRVCDLGKRTLILNLITAHIAKLNAPTSDGQDAPDLVGRISTASEGSVSVATDLPVPGTAAWWAQTKYGLQAWQALAPYRTAAYVVGPGAGYRAAVRGFPRGFIGRT